MLTRIHLFYRNHFRRQWHGWGCEINSPPAKLTEKVLVLMSVTAGLAVLVIRRR